jgi:hypothetical protein
VTGTYRGMQVIEEADGDRVVQGPAYSMALDFSIVDGTLTRRGKPAVINPKQLRARARRKDRRGESTAAEVALLYKPIDQWDIEELARGMPRMHNGNWPAQAPAWINRNLAEEATKRFQRELKAKIHTISLDAINLLQSLMQNNRKDAKGKPIVPPSTKADIAKWLVEHVVGKATQHIEADVGVKLQGVLAASIVMPGQLPAQAPVHVESIIVPASTAQIEDSDDDDDE